ncbi:gamma-aminobutyrate permease, partial [Campylobacter hyointestinalis subsp. lawsonii]
IIGQNYESFMQGKDMVSLLTSYIGLYLFLGIWFIHKIMTKSKPVDLLKADLSRNHHI